MKQKHRPLISMQFLTATLSTTLVLLLLGIVVFFVLTAGNLSRYMRENIGISVLLTDEVTDAQAMALQRRLAAAPYVKECVYISKADALAEQTEAMGTDPAEFLGYNPFTASLEVKLHAPYACTDSLVQIKQQLMADQRVSEVSYPEGLLDSLNRNVRKISFLLLALAALLSLISFALINNTIRLTLYAKRFLIHTMKLVGAGWGFIRRPFLLHHVWVGVCAGFLADLLLIGLAYMLLRYEPQLIQIISPLTVLVVMGSVFVFGVVITLLCAYISINKFLHMKAGKLYYV